jgi:phage terminase large subunit-like protein
MTRQEYRSNLKGRRCYVGMDLSSTQDLTALVAVFPDDAGFDVLAQFFVPKDNIHARATRDRVPYEQWAKDGYLVATPGDRIDHKSLRRTLQDWGEQFNVREIAFDPWNADALVAQLKDEDGFVCVPMNQKIAKMSAPTKSLEAAIVSKRLRHDGHPVLRWCVSNVSVEPDTDGNMKPSKKLSTEKIDGVIALVMAVGRMDVHSATPKEPDYQMMVF